LKLSRCSPVLKGVWFLDDTDWNFSLQPDFVDREF
jgi:hypothetical protein